MGESEEMEEMVHVKADEVDVQSPSPEVRDGRALGLGVSWLYKLGDGGWWELGGSLSLVRGCGTGVVKRKSSDQSKRGSDRAPTAGPHL